ncbi:MAG: hypothetical protein BroJett030_09680 [Alphaproteobacteria bacterium]|nr:MAG: hypothetical protein BroJett030_09680 [Alphaproteobacteria bacterium]
MLRTLDIAMIVALIAGATWTFKVKYDSEVALQELTRLERRLQIEREAIEILKADWSLLTSPDRLERLAARYRDDLRLEPARPEQVAGWGEVPARAALPAGEAPQERSAEAPAADAATVTGSVAPPPADPAAETGLEDDVTSGVLE